MTQGEAVCAVLLLFLVSLMAAYGAGTSYRNQGEILALEKRVSDEDARRCRERGGMPVFSAYGYLADCRPLPK